MHNSQNRTNAGAKKAANNERNTNECWVICTVVFQRSYSEGDMKHGVFLCRKTVVVVNLSFP